MKCQQLCTRGTWQSTDAWIGHSGDKLFARLLHASRCAKLQVSYSEQNTQFLPLWNLGPHEKISAINRKSNKYIITHLKTAVKGVIPFDPATSPVGMFSSITSLQVETGRQVIGQKDRPGLFRWVRKNKRGAGMVEDICENILQGWTALNPWNVKDHI